MPRIEEQPRVDELARPEPMRLVGKIRLELDRAGGLQDLVVDEAELALIELDLVVLAVGEDRERPPWSFAVAAGFAAGPSPAA